MFNSIFKQPKISLEKIFPFIDHIEVWAIFVKEVFLYREQSGIFKAQSQWNILRNNFVKFTLSSKIVLKQVRASAIY